MAKTTKPAGKKAAKVKDVEGISILSDAETAALNATEVSEKNTADLKAIIKGLLEALDETTQSSMEEIEKLQKALEAKSGGKTAEELPVIEVDGKEYQVCIPKFQFKGVVYSAADLEANEELAEALVAQKSGVLQLIVDNG